MPFRRRFRRGRFRRRRRTRLSGGKWRRPGILDTRYSVRDIARGAWRGFNMMRKLVNTELKKTDVSMSQSPGQSGTVQHLTGLQQGDDQNNRTGNSIFLNYVQMRFTLSRSATTSLVSTFVRIILFIDTQQVADTSPSVASVLESASVTAPLEKDNVGRFTIVRDMLFSLDASKSLSRIVKMNVPLRHHVRYNGTASTDVQKGGLYLLYISNEPNPDEPAIAGNCRVSYRDN